MENRDVGVFLIIGGISIILYMIGNSYSLFGESVLLILKLIFVASIIHFGLKPFFMQKDDE